MRLVEAFLKSSVASLATKDRSNLRFYVGMHAIISLTGKSKPSSSDLAKVDVHKLDDDAIEKSLALVWQEYEGLGGTDQVAKGPLLRKAIQKRVPDRMRSGSRGNKNGVT